MKKQVMALVLALTSVAGATAFTACNETEETVKLSGSTSVQPLMNELAAAFEELNEGIDVQVSGGGSGKGVSDAQDGTVDFGMASRVIKDTETGIENKTIAIDGIALIANKNCTVTDVSTTEVFDLYAYKTPVQNTITKAITRESGSGTRGAFEELIYKDIDGVKTLLETVSVAEGTTSFTSGGLVLTEIAKSTSVNTIGFVSLGAVNDTVKALKFNGVAATVENIKNGDYKLSRPFIIAWKSDKEMSEAAKKFYDFILSAEGQAIVAEEGYIRIDQ